MTIRVRVWEEKDGTEREYLQDEDVAEERRIDADYKDVRKQLAKV